MGERLHTFACQRMERFRNGRVLFAGDSAHGVSPFGARGANSGVQDADNLGWKLRLVLEGSLAPRPCWTATRPNGNSPPTKISWPRPARPISSRPKSPVSRMFRDAVLDLARDHLFARRLVNSGRLSVPTHYTASKLNTPGRRGLGRGHSTRRPPHRTPRCPPAGCSPDSRAPISPSCIGGGEAGDLHIERRDRRFPLRCAAGHDLSGAAGRPCLRPVAPVRSHCHRARQGKWPQDADHKPPTSPSRTSSTRRWSTPIVG